MRLLAVLLVALVAGCAAPPASSDPPVASSPLALLRCENLSGNFPVDAEAARAHLPEGFEPVLATQSPPRAVVFVVAMRCEAARVDGEEVGATQLGYVEIEVIPPAALARPNASDHTVPVFFVADQPRVGAALGSLMLGRAGAGEVVRSEQGPLGVTYDVSLRGESFTLAGTPAGEPASLGDAEFGVFAVQGGTLRGALDGHASAGEATRAALVLRGDAPLVAQAQPAASGGLVAGFDLDFRRVG